MAVRRAGACVAGVVALIGAIQCGFALDGFTGGAIDATDAGGDASSDEEAGSVDAAGATEAGSDDDAGTDAATADAGDGGCPGTGGPASVRVGSFCIDATEVTAAQYKAFLDSATKPAQPTVCSFNTSFAPSCNFDPAGAPKRPVACVDWCDAWTFCAWAGKRLCGTIGGGSLAYGNATSTAVSQWHYACSSAGTQGYSYGATYQAVCNTADRDAGAAFDVASLPACTGGYPGLFDLSGNVEEWIDACDGTTGSSDHCHEAGDGFDYFTDPPGIGRCDDTDFDLRGDHYPDVGFRCCAP